MTEIIALIGLNRSGKTETAKRIAKILYNDNKTTIIKSFATPLKQLASIYCNYNELTKLEQRPILEKLALDMKEIFGDTIFAYTLLDSIQHVDVDYIIIDDMRYVEEFDIISEFFPTTIIQTPLPNATDTNDSCRLVNLLMYLNVNDVGCVVMSDFSTVGLKRIISGIVCE